MVAAALQERHNRCMDTQTDGASRAPYDLIAAGGRNALYVRALCVLSAMLILAGCPSKPPGPGVRFPVTGGFHRVLPSAGQPILVWGDPPLAELAMEWLRDHHYASVAIPHNGPFQPVQIAHNFSTRAAALAVAREMKAEVVIVLEREATKEGTLIQSDCGRQYNVSVDLKGLSVETGETTLQGYAHYPHCVDLSEKTLRNLSCQAFATAWGFRAAGQLDIPSTMMCTAGQTDPMPGR